MLAVPTGSTSTRVAMVPTAVVASTTTSIQAEVHHPTWSQTLYWKPKTPGCETLGVERKLPATGSTSTEAPAGGGVTSVTLARLRFPSSSSAGRGIKTGSPRPVVTATAASGW